jgi:hypothetical protein
MAVTLSGSAFAQGMGVGVGIDDILPRGSGARSSLCGVLLTGGTNLLTAGAVPRLLTGCTQPAGPLLTISTNLSTTGTDLSTGSVHLVNGPLLTIDVNLSTTGTDLSAK